MKKSVHRAVNDFEGNLTVGEEIYVSDVQNRYIIIQYQMADKMEYYENQAYLSKEVQ